MTNFPKYLKELRGAESIRSVAQVAGLSNSYLSQLEKGEKTNPNPDILRKLAKHYNIPVTEMLIQAGYMDKEDLANQVSFEYPYAERIDQLFDHVRKDPNYKHGVRIRGEIPTDVKRFVIEIYEKATGKQLITEEIENSKQSFTVKGSKK